MRDRVPAWFVGFHAEVAEQRHMENAFRLLTADEAAKVICLSSRSVRELVTEGKLHAVRLGPQGVRVMFFMEGLREYVQQSQSMARLGSRIRSAKVPVSSAIRSYDLNKTECNVQHRRARFHAGAQG
jgi:excisionase family DNA binding protein